MAVTLKQIAERTGLSIPTVHQILNNYNVSFSDDTRKKVLDAATTLKYTPNLAARSLVQQRSLTMGVLYNGVNYAFLINFYRGVQAVLGDRGFAPILLTHATVQEELDNARLLVERGVDAVIVNVAVDEDGSTRKTELAEVLGKTPTVEVFGQFMDNIPNVRLDYAATAAATVKELVDRGHSSIALLVREKFDQPGERYWSARDFVAGYHSAIRKSKAISSLHAYTVPENNLNVGAHFRGAYLVAETVVNDVHKPTAVVCYTRESAEGLTRWIDKQRFAVPNGFTVAYIGTPLPVSSDAVRQFVWAEPAEAVGRMAIETAFSLIGGASVESAALAPVSGMLQEFCDQSVVPSNATDISIRREPIMRRVLDKTTNQRPRRL